jgi:hypothetical protein
MRLFEMVDLANMLGRMGELKADALTMPAGRKATALDHRDLVRHVGVRRIMRNRLDTGLRYDLAGLVFLGHGYAPIQTIDDLPNGVQPGCVPGKLKPADGKPHHDERLRTLRWQRWPGSARSSPGR